MGGNNAVINKKETYESVPLREFADRLKSHPNYITPKPLNGEKKVDFILRSIAHLISPPMEEGESNEMECTDVANAVRAMGAELEEIWKNHVKSK